MFYTNLYAACPQKGVYFLTPSPSVRTDVIYGIPLFFLSLDHLLLVGKSAPLRPTDRDRLRFLADIITLGGGGGHLTIQMISGWE